MNLMLKIISSNRIWLPNTSILQQLNSKTQTSNSNQRVSIPSTVSIWTSKCKFSLKLMKRMLHLLSTMLLLAYCFQLTMPQKFKVTLQEMLTISSMIYFSGKCLNKLMLKLKFDTLK